MLRSIVIVSLCFSAITAHAALLGRSALTPGGSDFQAYYDTALNITWVADPNLAASNQFGVAGIECIEVPSDCQTYPPGMMDWYKAHEWTAAMNAANYLGVSNWRLPTADKDGNGFIRDCRFSSEVLCRDNELGYQYWKNGVSTANSGPFHTLPGYVGISYYGSGTESPTDPSSRWIINFGIQLSGMNPKTADTYVWAVSTGDLMTVPLPAGFWLFASALGVMGWLRRRVST